MAVEHFTARLAETTGKMQPVLQYTQRTACHGQRQRRQLPPRAGLQIKGLHIFYRTTTLILSTGDNYLIAKARRSRLGNGNRHGVFPIRPLSGLRIIALHTSRIAPNAAKDEQTIAVKYADMVSARRRQIAQFQPNGGVGRIHPEIGRDFSITIVAATGHEQTPCSSRYGELGQCGRHGR